MRVIYLDSDPRKVSPILAAVKRPKDVIQPRWGVYALRAKRAERFAFAVQARDGEEAIARAVKEFEIPERDRWRISVQREA